MPAASPAPPRVCSPAAPALSTRLPELVAAAPDPAMALASWEALARGRRRHVRRWHPRSPTNGPALFTLLGGSQVLAQRCAPPGRGGSICFASAGRGAARTAADHRRDIVSASGEPWEPFSERLRQVRHREYLRIGLNDLAGRYTVDATMTELSALAGGAFAAAYDWARQTLQVQYGEFCRAARQDAGSALRTRFVVLAMGKLGGGELNFSSDVDVMYLCASDEGDSGGGPRGTLGGA